MAKPSYTQELSRWFPGLFVILLDQSSSMKEPVKGYPKELTKAEIVTMLVNDVIKTMIENAGMEETIPGIRKKYAYLSVLGYDNDVRPLLSTVDTPVDIPTLAKNHLGVIKVKRQKRDANGRLIETITESKTVWIEPYIGLNTNMTKAFERAREVVSHWLQQSPELISDDLGYQMPRMESFPPVVINVTDGFYTTGGNPQEVVRDLCRLRTNNGNVLVFNCHFSLGSQGECIFPGQESGIPADFELPDNIVQRLPADRSEREKHIQHYQRELYELAKNMYAISSVIPDPLRVGAQSVTRKLVRAGARGVIYNASFDILAQFLKWGTVDMAPTTMQTAGSQR